MLTSPTGDFSLYPSLLSERDTLVGVSVSGEVVDLLDLCERLQGRHRLVGITNQADSTLARLVGDLLVTRAGKSLVPTSTKTFTTTTAALYLLWLGLLEAAELDAPSVVFVLPVAAVFFVAQRYFIQGISLTGVKA